MIEAHLRTLQASVPVTSAQNILKVAKMRGITEEDLLNNTDLTNNDLQQSDHRIAVWQYANMICNLVTLTADPSTSIEIGLLTQLTKAGVIGYGLMSCSTLLGALEFGCRFFPILCPFFKLELDIQNDMVIVTVHDVLPALHVRNFILEHFLISVSELFRALLLGHNSTTQYQHLHLYLDYPEPTYFSAYKARLPHLHFNQAANQFQFSTVLLNLPIQTANIAVLQMIIEHSESELVRLGLTKSWLDRVRALLVCRNGQYPDLPSIAANLHVSERTLKRKLAELNLSYSSLLDTVRLRDASHFLEKTELSIDDIASRLGYQDPANFSRAFRRWLGITPSQYRKDAHLSGHFVLPETVKS